MPNHIVFLERNSVKAQIRRPGFEHTYEEYPHTFDRQAVERLRPATIAIINKVQYMCTVAQATINRNFRYRV